MIFFDREEKQNQILLKYNCHFRDLAFDLFKNWLNGIFIIFPRVFFFLSFFVSETGKKYLRNIVKTSKKKKNTIKVKEMRRKK